MRCTNSVSPRSSSSTRVEHRWPARRMVRSTLAVASWASHISDANRGSPAFSGRNSTPHSTQLCCNEIAERRAGSTESSAPQKPTLVCEWRWTGEGRPFLPGPPEPWRGFFLHSSCKCERVSVLVSSSVDSTQRHTLLVLRYALRDDGIAFYLQDRRSAYHSSPTRRDVCTAHLAIGLGRLEQGRPRASPTAPWPPCWAARARAARTCRRGAT